MNKIVIVRPDEGKAQDLEGLKKYLKDHAQSATVEEKETHIEITCPANFVNGIVPLVEKYGYWASELQDAEVQQ